MFPVKRGLLSAVLLLASACASSRGPGARTSLTHGATLRGCPLGVAGGSVTAQDTPTGITLSFTSKDHTSEMQARVYDAASEHGLVKRLGLGHERRHGQGDDHGLDVTRLPRANVMLSTVEGGATLDFVPDDPADRELLRAKLRARMALMNASTCE